MRKFFAYILTPIPFLTFWLILIIFQPIQWVCYNFFGYSVHKKSVDALNFCLMGTYYMFGNSIRFINKQHLPVNRPIIFVANHQSLFDIPPLSWFLRDHHPKFISKVELTKNIPSISYNLKHGGGANIDRKDPRQSIMEIVKLGNRMKENKWSAVIFPEGTRSLDGHVKPFQSGGIATLLKKCPEALIVPVAIHNSWKMIRFGLFPLNIFISMSWEVLTPIEPGTSSAEELVLASENMIKQHLASKSG